MRKFSLLFFFVLISLNPLKAQESDETALKIIETDSEIPQTVEEIPHDNLEIENISEESDVVSEEKKESQDEEDAPSIWEDTLDSETVDLMLDGYWKLRFMGGTAFAETPDEILFPTLYPGLKNTLVMEQEPDILLSLWIQDRWYLEGSYIKDFEKNTLALGFKEEDWFFHHLRVGNSNLNVQGFAGLTPPAPQFNTPGLVVEAAGNSNEHELLFRLEGSLKETRIYQGTYLVEEQSFSPGAWEQGRFFLLPNRSINNSSLRIYKMDPEGTISDTLGYKYNLMEPGQYRLDFNAGIVEFLDTSEAAIYIFYQKGEVNIGAPDLAESILPGQYGNTGIVNPNVSEDFSWASLDRFTGNGTLTYGTTRLRTIEGNDCLLLKEPGEFSPFEFYNFYTSGISFSEDQWKNGVELVYKNSNRRLENQDITLSTESDGVRILLPQIPLTDPRNRYPLQEMIPQLYGPGGEKLHEEGPLLLRFYSLSTSDGYSLPDQLVEDSLTIFINGYPSAEYRIENNKINFNRFIYPSDRIELHYRLENPSYEGGELLLYQGNALDIGEKNSLELGSMVRWILPGGTTENQQGVISLSGTYNYSGQQLNSNLNIRGSLTDPDTDGLSRILSMERDKYLYSIYPGILQSSDSSFDATTGGNLSISDFVEAQAYDYDSDDGLRHYGISTPESLNKTGPSAAAPMLTDPMDSPVMILPYDLEANQWSGGNIMVYAEKSRPIDYSTLQEIRLKIRTINETTPLQVDMLFGQTGESLDHDNNGILNQGDSNFYNLFDLNDLSSDSIGDSWTEVSILLNDENRQKLEQTEALTFLLHDSGRDQATSGSLIIGDIRFFGQGFSTSIFSDSGELTHGEIIAREISDNSLETAYSSEMDLLHSDDEEQRITRIEWGESTPLLVNQTWLAKKQLSLPITRDYRFLNFFIRDPESPSPGIYTLSILDRDNKGLVLQFDPQDTEWHKIRFNLFEGILDSPQSGVSLVRWDNDSGDLEEIRIEGSNSQSGSFDIDELYQEDSVYQLASQGTWDLSFNSPALWVTKEDFHLFSGLKLKSSLTGRTWEQLGFEESRDLTYRHLWDMEANLLWINLGVYLDYSLSPEQNRMEGGHHFKIPWNESPLYFSEGFSLTDGQEDLLFSQKRSVSWNSEVIKSEINQSSVLEKQERNRDWEASLSLDFESPYTADLNGNLHLRTAENLTEKSYDYLSGWMESWSDTVKTTGDHQHRDSSINIGQNYQWSKGIIQSTLKFHQSSQYQPLWTERGIYSSDLSFPIFWGPETNRKDLILYYRRNKNWESEEEGNSQFLKDWSQYAHSLGQSLPLIREIPLVELFHSSYQPQVSGVEGTDVYQVSSGFSFSRPIDSSLYNLFIPVGFKADLSRHYEESQLENWYRNDWSFTLEQHGVNLLGRHGTNPTFNFYLTDDIASNWTFSLSSYNDPLPDPQKLEWDFIYSIKGERDLQISLENQLELDFHQEDTRDMILWNLSWRSKSKPYYLVPFIDWVIDREFFLEQQESISYTWNNPWLMDSDVVKTQEIFFEHHWILNYTGLGKLNSWLKCGYKNEIENGDKTWRTGAELGIEMIFNF